MEVKAFTDGWHIEAMCDHLEAVTYGDITRLMINIPPRHTKSLLVSVIWPMWEWLHYPESQFLLASYSHNLTKRDNVRARRLFYSARYQELIAAHQPGLVLVGDQNTKIKYENSSQGYRLATSVDGGLTGEGGDKIIIDDAHNVRDGESETKRLACLAWWDEAMSTRLNDADTGAYVIIMQRVHQADLCGHILDDPDEAKDWDHLCLPIRYEGHNRVISSLGYTDPRTKEDEILCPGRYSESALTKLERRLGAYGRAGQLQQNPGGRGQGIFKAERIAIIQGLNPNFVTGSIRYWDKAGTEGGGGARTAGVLMHLMKSNGENENGRIIVEDVVKGRWSYAEREARILQTAKLDALKYGPGNVEIIVEQEPGSGGKESAERTILALRGHVARAERPVGDKEKRAEPFSIAVENGDVSCVAGDWVGGKDGYIKELEMFPGGKYKDQVDSSSGAYSNLVLDLGGRYGTW